MRRTLLVIFATTLATFSSATWGAETILSTLRLGELTPRELNELYPGARTEIPKGDQQTVVHFKDERGSKGVCHFVEDRLFRYTVTLGRQSPDVTMSGGWQGMVAAAESAFGTPQVHADDRVQWDLDRLAFSLSRGGGGGITVTLRDKRLEQVAQQQSAVMRSAPTTEQRFVYGGPYHLSGFRPEITRKVALTRGRYHIALQHSGHSNFIVYMHSPWSQDLVANEIGASYAHRVISVEGEVEECFFLVQDADGPWTIDVKKVVLTIP